MIAIEPGSIISRIAAAVARSTMRAGSGSTPGLPSSRPGISRNWRRISSTIAPAARPTAFIVEAATRHGRIGAEQNAHQHVGVDQVELERRQALERAARR